MVTIVGVTTAISLRNRALAAQATTDAEGPRVGGLIASLIFAAFIAWYVSKPIRSLRAAFDAAARGDLDVRLSSKMGGRRDELADLGRDFDRTSVQLKALMDGQRHLLHDVSHE